MTKEYTEEQAKYERDKRLIEENPTLNKAEAVHFLKVLPENFDKFKAETEKKPDVEDEFLRLDVYSDEDLQTYEPPEQEWLIKDILPKSEIGLLVGKRGERKTFTALEMAYALGSGNKCFGVDEVPEKKKVLIVEEEGGKPEMARRSRAIKKGKNLDQPLDIKFISFSGIKLDQQPTEEFPNRKWTEFKKLVSEWLPDLIIVDCLQRVVSFEVDKDNAEISRFFTEIVRQFTKAYGCSWLFLHHLRKGLNGNSRVEDPLDEVRGGSELVNYVRFVLSCQLPKHQTNEAGVELMIFRVLKMSNSERLPARVVAFRNEGDKLLVTYEGEPEEVLASEVKCGNAIKEYIFVNQLFEFKTSEINDVADDIGFKKTLISSGLNYLLKKGILQKVKRGIWKVAGDNHQTSLGNVKPKKQDNDDYPEYDGGLSDE